MRQEILDLFAIKFIEEHFDEIDLEIASTHNFGLLLASP